MELFTPLGEEGAAALEDLCRTIPDPNVAATGLEALFESNPAAAAAIAEERLAKSLAARCVPGSLVALLARQNRDPFRPVAEKLDGLSCDRGALRPDDAVPLGKEADPARVAARAAAERLSGACRKGFESLFGLDRPPEPWE